MLEGVVRAQLQDGGAEDGPREEALTGGADPRLKRSEHVVLESQEVNSS